MEWEYGVPEENLRLPGNGLFIINEGNFQYGNATLSYYNHADNSVENEVFQRANAMKLGDVAQSMTVYNGLGWIVVNNSHAIFAVDIETGREKGRIVNLTSPRYIHFVSPEKAYVTQIWDNRIVIVNPRTYSVSGYITVPGMNMQTGSTEQMAAAGDYLFVSCWSYQNRILKIDTRTDRIVAELTVGIQPSNLVVDHNDRLWALCDGGYENSPYGHEPPSLYRIDTERFEVEKVWHFNPGDETGDLCINGDGSRIYWINDDVYTMSVDSSVLPDTPLVSSRSTRYYALTVSPYDNNLYVADAVDYQQLGAIYRYTPTGALVDSFYAGVNPGAFCWK